MSSKTAKKKAMVPKLRFPEFRDTGPWERYKFGELLTLEYGGSLPEESRLDGSIPVVGSNGVVGFHSEALVSGPVIIVGRKGSVGEVNWIESDCYPIDTTFYVKLKFHNSLLVFIKLLLENANLTSLSDNGAVPGLNRNDVYVIKTALPSEAEQQKIADCLSSLDEVIEFQTKRLEVLNAHKKGLMQQLFPREGETTPRLRFPEFRDAGPWEVKRLGEIIEEFRKQSTVQDEYEVLTSSRKGLLRQKEYYEENRITAKDNIGFNIIPPNYITYRSRSDDRRFYFNENTLGITGIISVYYPVFRITEGSNKFIVEMLNHSWIEVGKRSVGTSQTVLSVNELKRLKMPIPSPPEQQKIADCLSSIDEVIELQTKKLEALKAHKKGLMQQLFPQEVG